jgi:hypothetical protein
MVGTTPGAVLLNRLRNWTPSRGEYSTLMLVSLSALPTSEEDEVAWKELDRILITFKARHGAAFYNLSRADRALLVKLTEYNQVGIISDLKLELLRLIQEYFPDYFGLVDQTKLIRVVDLTTRVKNAVAFLEKYEDSDPPVTADPTARRSLREGDIARVEEHFNRIGKDEFAKKFVRHQSMAVLNPGQAPARVMRELFVGLDMLKKEILPDVELRAAGNIFNHLTITLDRLLLSVFNEVNPSGTRCSINLNVESVFTRAFEEFLKGVDEAAMRNVVFEFRQANILQHYDEFEVACNVITSRKGVVAIDSIVPESLGIVDLSRLRARIAKVFWRQGAEVTLPQRRDEVRAMNEAGILVTLARVDDEAAVEIGQGIGINMFQGFYIDTLIDKIGA